MGDLPKEKRRVVSFFGWPTQRIKCEELASGLIVPGDLPDNKILESDFSSELQGWWKLLKAVIPVRFEIWFVNQIQRWCKLRTKVLYAQLGSDLQINLKDDAQESLICTADLICKWIRKASQKSLVCTVEIWFVNGSQRWWKLLKEVLYARLRSELLFKMMAGANSL